MPIRRTGAGWWWGGRGPFPTKAKALAVAQAAHGNGFKEIVIGPPCAGKSSYVAKKAAEGSIVVDYDKLAFAIGNKNTHNATGQIKRITNLIRNSLIDEIVKGIENDAYIIHTMPNAEQIKKYREAGARFVMINPGKDVCLNRAKERPQGTDQVINKWFDSPPDIGDEYINGYEEDMRDNTCAEFVLCLFHAVTNTHLLHLQTRSFSVHMALGAYYPDLEELIDTFAEAYQGKYGIIDGYKNDYALPVDPLPYLIGISDYIKTTRANLPQDSELQNLIDEIASLTDGTIYKLRFLD